MIGPKLHISSAVIGAMLLASAVTSDVHGIERLFGNNHHGSHYGHRTQQVAPQKSHHHSSKNNYVAPQKHHYRNSNNQYYWYSGLHRPVTRDAQVFYQSIKHRCNEYGGQRVNDSNSRNFDAATHNLNRTIDFFNRGAKGQYRYSEAVQPSRLNISENHRLANIVINGSGSFENAQNMHNYGLPRIGVLNCGNARKAGGGYVNGRTAQEEGLCCKSTLFASLGAYRLNKVYETAAMNYGTCILSPYVRVFGAQEFDVSVLTAAAVDRRGHVGRSERSMRDRVFDIVMASAYYGYRNIVLAGFGCGVFKNDPYRVARYFLEALQLYGGYFDNVVFALTDPIVRQAFSGVFAQYMKAHQHSRHQQNAHQHSRHHQNANQNSRNRHQAPSTRHHHHGRG